MKLNEVMTKDPQYITPDLTLAEAARKMRELDVGFLPVGDGVKLKGMLTDRDIVLRAVADGIDLNTAKAGDFITEQVLYAFEDQDVEFAYETMRDKQVRRLIILNRDKDMVGVVSLGDLATRTDDVAKQSEALAGVSRH